MEKTFMEQAFQTCKEHGWISELIPAAITEEQIADFEKHYDIKLSKMYRAFLTTYQLSGDLFDICGIACSCDELRPLWLMLDNVQSIPELEENIKTFRQIAEIQNDEGQEEVQMAQMCAKIVPLGDWGAGWGAALSGFDEARGARRPRRPRYLVTGVV